jgi:SHS2 domain-containing protein
METARPKIELQGYELISDMPEVKLRVWGKTLRDLFRNALKGMAAYLHAGVFDAVRAGLKEKHAVRVEAVDINTLLVAFLSEVAARTDMHNVVFINAAFTTFGENFLEGDLTGVKVGELEKEIKAVSYEDVNVSHNKETGLYEAVLVFEV